METMEDIDVKVEENQISFDFLSPIEPDKLTQTENFEWTKNETLVVIIRAKSGFSADFDLCGKSMVEWVEMATSGCTQKVIEQPDEDDFLPKIKELAGEFKFVAVFYSDTPLFRKSTFLEIMDYFSKHRMNVLKLLRGYVFKGEYLKNTRMLLSTTIEEFDKQDFCIVDNAEKISLAFDVLRKRILDYHKQNGVVLFGEDTIFIDADVEIEEGVIIYPNNVLSGKTYVGKDVILQSGNFIVDTVVCEEAFIQASYLDKCKVEKGKIVGPFSKFIDKQV